MNTTYLEKQLEEVNFDISQLEAKKRFIEKKLNDIRKDKNIQELGISMDKIEFSDGKDKPFFGHVADFQAWLVENNVTKPFCTWNGEVYSTSDLLDGRMAENLCIIDDIVK